MIAANKVKHLFQTEQLPLLDLERERALECVCTRTLCVRGARAQSTEWNSRPSGQV